MLERETTYHFGHAALFEEDLEHEFKDFKRLIRPGRFRSNGDIAKNVIAFLNSASGGTLYGSQYW